MANYKFYSEITLLDENNKELYKFIQASNVVVQSREEYVLCSDFFGKKEVSLSTSILETPREFKEAKELINNFCKIDKKVYSVNQVTMEKEMLFHTLYTVVKKWNLRVDLPTDFKSTTTTPVDGGYIRINMELEEEEVNG